MEEWILLLFAEGSIVSLCTLRVEWLQPRAGFVSWLFLVWLGDLFGSPGWGLSWAGVMGSVEQTAWAAAARFLMLDLTQLQQQRGWSQSQQPLQLLSLASTCTIEALDLLEAVAANVGISAVDEALGYSCRSSYLWIFSKTPVTNNSWDAPRQAHAALQSVVRVPFDRSKLG